jgi:hypothetical protein
MEHFTRHCGSMNGERRMPAIEDAKRVAEKVTGWMRPDRDARLCSHANPMCFRFKDDGETPNNPTWLSVIYRTPVKLQHGTVIRDLARIRPAQGQSGLRPRWPLSPRFGGSGRPR